MKRIILKPGREKSLKRRHPWIFSGAIERVDGGPEPGETVMVVSSGGELLALAAFSARSQIRARVWSFDPEPPIDDAFMDAAVKRALE